MARYKLTISYDGTPFCGWQVQSNGVSIQSLIQKALEVWLRHPIALTGAGRTDAQVHAKGQTAHFDSEVSFSSQRLLYGLNALLPKEIRILAVEAVPPDFHARYSATSKIYHYHLHLDPILDPFVRPYRCHVLGPFDKKQVEKALPFFLGTCDFASFANRRESRKPVSDTVRTLLRLEMKEQKGGIRFEVEGNGFLYKMVRNVVGTLLEIGAGKKKAEEIMAILKAKERRLAGAAAPPQGLFLMEVCY